jgi:hypothetical protein
MPETKPKSRKDLTFDEIASALANCDGTSVRQSELLAELTRRQTMAQIEATHAQKQNAKYMLWTALAAAASAIFSAIGIFTSHH